VLGSDSGCEKRPGIDLLFDHPGGWGGNQIIEAKGTVGTIDVELTDNARPNGCNLRGRYTGFTSSTTVAQDLR
jgi:hypothetical protein